MMSDPKYCYLCDEILTFCCCKESMLSKDELIEYLKAENERLTEANNFNCKTLDEVEALLLAEQAENAKLKDAIIAAEDALDIEGGVSLAYYMRDYPVLAQHIPTIHSVLDTETGD